MGGAPRRDDSMGWLPYPASTMVVAFIALSSLCSCLWLLSKLCRLSASMKRRLFVRQITHLALADALFHLASLPIIVMLRHEQGAWLALLCGGLRTAFHTSRMCNVLFQAFMALTFLLQSFRCLGCVAHLDAALNAVWLLALLLGGLDTYVREDAHHCGRTFRTSGMLVSLATVYAAYALCFVSYLATILRGWFLEVPRSVQAQNFRRATWYNLNFLICFTPVMIAYHRPELFEEDPFRSFAVAAESLAGLLNTTTYSKQSRYAALLWPDCQRRTALREESRQLERPPGPAPRSLSSIGTSSFRVEFGGVDVRDLSGRASERHSHSVYIAEFREDPYLESGSG